MQFNDNDRVKFIVTATADVDLTAATVKLAVDNVEYPCTWTNPAASTSGQWVRTASTDAYFAGPAVPVGSVAGAVVLAYGRHVAEVRVTAGSVIKAAECDVVTVR